MLPSEDSTGDVPVTGSLVRAPVPVATLHAYTTCNTAMMSIHVINTTLCRAARSEHGQHIASCGRPHPGMPRCCRRGRASVLRLSLPSSDGREPSKPPRASTSQSGSPSALLVRGLSPVDTFCARTCRSKHSGSFGTQKPCNATECFSPTAMATARRRPCTRRGVIHCAFRLCA